MLHDALLAEFIERAEGAPFFSAVSLGFDADLANRLKWLFKIRTDDHWTIFRARFDVR